MKKKNKLSKKINSHKKLKELTPAQLKKIAAGGVGRGDTPATEGETRRFKK